MDGVAAITLFTLGTSLLGTALLLPAGTLLAWLLARRRWPGKALVESAVSLPIFIPPVATGLILLRLFGRRGPLGRLCSDLFGVDVVFTWRAVVVAVAVMGFPLFVRTARVAFEAVDRRLEETARTLGARPWDVFVGITLPLAARGLVGGTILAFARGLGEFGATVMVAGLIQGRTITLALGIYQAVQLGNDRAALVLLLIAAAAALTAGCLGEWVLRGGRGAK